jgi:NADPH:quinone reductase-like Zn-dependent oxidoreductase
MVQDKDTTMRSLAIEKYCKPDEYQILNLPIPDIKAPDELLIKVHATSINPIDVKVSAGQVKTVWPVR